MAAKIFKTTNLNLMLTGGNLGIAIPNYGMGKTMLGKSVGRLGIAVRMFGKVVLNLRLVAPNYVSPGRKFRKALPDYVNRFYCLCLPKSATKGSAARALDQLLKWSYFILFRKKAGEKTA